MKKVLAALVMVLGTGSSVVFAQEVNNSSAIVAEAQVPQDEFVKIDPTELPQAVMQTLAKDYEGASVKEAYVKETEETTLYKIIIVTQDGQEAETLLNEKGEIVKEESFLNVNLIKERIPVRDESEFFYPQNTYVPTEIICTFVASYLDAVSYESQDRRELAATFTRRIRQALL